MRNAELWQLGSIALLLSVIATGFAWFEQSRPSARTVATVAALVAFAVIGRLLFAPFPNVKPTTDIVIIAGFALGFAPGWTVGVLTALVSNFYFAQGPWTPWQMLAWGVCGLIGALAARSDAVVGVGAGRRLPMALVCAACGLIYGVIVNFGSAVNLASGDVLTAFQIQMTTSLPFDIAHAVGNFGFFLIVGPMLIKMLERIAIRESVVWHPQNCACNSAQDSL
jgi:energy-coupling factor transport system substrate-specific component